MTAEPRDDKATARRHRPRWAVLDLVLAPIVTLLVLAMHWRSGAQNTPADWLLAPSAWVLASFLLSSHARFRRGPGLVLRRARKILLAGLALTPLVAAVRLMHAYEWMLTVAFVWGALHVLTLARYALTELRPTQGERASTMLGKGGAVRSATAAGIATFVDFSLFTLLLWVGWFSAPVATFLGAVTGGVLNFTLNRTWTFNASGTKSKMARRYVGVSATSALLNAGFVAVLLWVPGQLAVTAWLIARGLVFLAWNYPLHRDYVFEHLGSRPHAA